MNTDERAVRDLLAPHDPASAVRVDAEQLARARVDAVARGASRAPGAPGRPRRRRRGGRPRHGRGVRPRLLGDGLRGSPSCPLAVVPSELGDAREELLALAETAEVRSASAPGDVAYVRTSQWRLTLAQDADTGESGWGIAPVDHQVWRSVEEDAGYWIEHPLPPRAPGGGRVPPPVPVRGGP
ncbi:hypothetical protein NI17_003710 [Thermobifida halotolerans]|uniref:Uncharacterized protein n=1 Tax=Thermobifida halotolerans TaxID=483545 RepID=A0AA97LYU4_9ACTN|nr:hypothetical protein [Thermobifida halotolerans]UOE20355.1 hypothetical protein NI17_003710 [Thermobifida halotolerans]